MSTNNEHLHNIVMARPDLTVKKLMEITGRSRTQVYGWLCPVNSKHFKKMKRSDLRLLKLELGMASPRFTEAA